MLFAGVSRPHFPHPHSSGLFLLDGTNEKLCHMREILDAKSKGKKKYPRLGSFTTTQLVVLVIARSTSSRTLDSNKDTRTYNNHAC